MKFLFDVGISPRLGKLLMTQGHSFRYLPNHYSNKTPDFDILEIAIENDEVIITHDLDFGTLLAFSGQNSPSVILFRIHHIEPVLFYKLILDNWDTIEQPLESGSLVIIELNSIRIRPLPISKRQVPN
jgi:predicted nuclease of predicted toxin-antitoxin system